MASSQSLFLNEETLSQLSEAQRSEVIFTWLTHLKQLLPNADRADLKFHQRRLVEQLWSVVIGSPGPPVRWLLADCLSLLYAMGDPVNAPLMVDRCNDIIRSRDDSPSGLPTRLAAIACLGSLFEQLGRMLSGCFKDTLTNLLKAIRSAESQGRCEIMHSVEKAVRGLGVSCSHTHRDLYKAARACLSDRAMAVRCAAAMCLLELQREAVFLWTSELENISTVCFRAFEGSDSTVRVCVAKLLGTLLAAACNRPVAGRAAHSSLEEVMDLLSAGFLRGGASFLRASGDILKGTSSVCKETRIGVTQSCVVFVSLLGSTWLEANFPSFLSLLMELAANAKATHTPADAMVTHRCVCFILSSTLGSLLGEKAQTNAAKTLCEAIGRQKPAIDSAVCEGNVESRVSPCEVSASQHVLVCCLSELGRLIHTLGSTAAPLLTDSALLETLLPPLLHPAPPACLSAAWCLRCVAVAMPTHTTLLLDACVDRLRANMEGSVEAVRGYSAAVAALLAATQHCSLGIPHSKAMMVLGLGEDLLRSASQSSRLALQKTQSGWLLLSALITLGPAVIEHPLPSLLSLCRCVFPLSLREQERESSRGDSFTWQVTLEGRAGALYALKQLLTHCRELLTDDIISRLLTPLACAVALLPRLPSLLRCYGSSLRSFSVVYKQRVYELLALMSPQTYQESFGLLMNQLVCDLLSQSSEASLSLADLCHHDDLTLTGPAPSSHTHTHWDIEEQLCGSPGSLQNDPFSLCDRGNCLPAPLPVSLSLTEATVALFGRVFPHIISAQRVKILEQFVETLSTLKGNKQLTVQTNICAALCRLLKNQGVQRASLGPDEVRSPALSILTAALESTNPLLRCMAAEGLSRLVQLIGDPGFTVSVSLLCFDRLKSARDAACRSGFSLALGSSHRHSGGISSSQHLASCLSVLFTLSQDSSSPEVQTWSLHSLSVLIDLSGALYRPHAEATFSLVIRLLLSATHTHTQVHRSLGRCVCALITCLGPDLQEETPAMSSLRSSLVIGCSLMQSSADCLVQAEAVRCLQHTHMFSPGHTQLASLVPALCEILLDYSTLANLCSQYVCVRRAVVACLRQLVQREAVEVCGLAVTLVKDLPRREHSQLDVTLKEVGLEGALFTLLDRESDSGLKRDIQETLVHMMSSNATSGKLGHWLKLCKDVLSATTDCLSPVADSQNNEEDVSVDDSSVFKANSDSTGPFTALRWDTRRFAMQCVCGIVAQCETAKDSAHFNLQEAQERRLTESTDFLVLHLGSLVAMAFLASTDHSEPLRLAGLQTLLVIIKHFAHVPEPEFPGHVILEQYQANVGAALRPAFSTDASPLVTAKACQVCSAWIASGVVSDLRDIRRVHQLLAVSLAKVQEAGNSDREASTNQQQAPPPPLPPPPQLYSEATVTMETLAVLKAWAEVYIVAVHRSRERRQSQNSIELAPANHSAGLDSEGAGLLALVQSELSTLSRLWLAALQDYGLLTLPQEYQQQLPKSGGSFYTAETVKQARAHYSSSWAPILHATALWLHSTGFVMSDDGPHLSRPATPTSMGHTPERNKSSEETSCDRLNLILGISIEFLCSPHSSEQMENITSCLRALQELLDVPWPRNKIGMDQPLSVELLSVLHRLMLTREAASVQSAILDLLKQIVSAAKEHVREKRHSAEVDDGASEKESFPEFGEGRDTGGLIPGQSLVFGSLQLCVCVLGRKLPQISPTLSGTNNTAAAGSVWTLSLTDCQLVSSALFVLSELPSVCSPEGSVSILPTVLYLLLGVFRELVQLPHTHTGAPAAAAGEGGGVGVGGGAGVVAMVTACVQSLKSVMTSPMSRQEKSKGSWVVLLRSALKTLLDIWETDRQVDHLSLLSALSVFLHSAGQEVCLKEPLHSLCMERILYTSEDKNPQVVIGCYQLMTSLFQAPPPLAVPYIKALGPKLVRFLQSVEGQRPQTEAELQVVLEAVSAMEALVHAAEHNQRPQLMCVLLPLLISLLLDENTLTSSPEASRALHESVLQDLMRLGPLNTAVFRCVISGSPALKARLEAAVRGNQQTVSAKAGANANANSGANANKASPSITLKTNFL